MKNSETLRFKTSRGLTVFDVWFTTARLRRRGRRIRLVVIDDLQRLQPRAYRRKIADLQVLAQELQLPVIVLSRLSARDLGKILAPRRSSR